MTYKQAQKEEEKARRKITRQAKKKIKEIYDKAADLMVYRLNTITELSTLYVLMQVKVDLEAIIRDAAEKMEEVVLQAVKEIAKTTTGTEAAYWRHIVDDVSFDLGRSLAHKYDGYCDAVITRISSGAIYRDGRGFSDRIWSYQSRMDGTIDRMIRSAVSANLSAYDTAKMLEAYVKPSAKHPWDWGAVYPMQRGTMIDYNAQRLARTTITHAYQLALTESTATNPYVSGYEWHSSNASRVCDLCQERDGTVYDKGAVPLDHPNGMCTITCVMTADLDEIASDLEAYVDGEDNAMLDAWLK